jgi:hypothetical protein
VRARTERRIEMRIEIGMRAEVRTIEEEVPNIYLVKITK